MEPLIKSAMNRVAIKNEMIARRTTKVVLDVRSQGVQRRKRAFLVQPEWDSGFAGGLRCQTPHEGNSHSFRRISCIPSCKAAVAAMWDLIRGSLNL